MVLRLGKARKSVRGKFMTGIKEDLKFYCEYSTHFKILTANTHTHTHTHTPAHTSTNTHTASQSVIHSMKLEATEMVLL